MSNLLASGRSTAALPRAHAFAPGEQRELHLALTHMNRARLTPGMPQDTWKSEHVSNMELAVHEGAFLERERRAVQSR